MGFSIYNIRINKLNKLVILIFLLISINFKNVYAL